MRISEVKSGRLQQPIMPRVVAQFLVLNTLYEVLSARGPYATCSWFLAIAVNVQDLFLKYECRTESHEQQFFL